MTHAPIDSLVHHEILAGIVASGAAPSEAALALKLGDGVAASIDRLVANHGLVLHPGSRDVWIAHPFSLSPTAVWVAAATRGWWAPCLWCGLGVAALVGDVQIHVRAGGEDQPLVISVAGGEVDRHDLVVHFPMPPRRAWDNVIHFCAMLLPFGGAAAVDPWCARHGFRRGEVVPLATMNTLARRWYGRHLAPDWVKWTPAEAAAIFAEVGLTGPFWSLDDTATRF